MTNPWLSHLLADRGLISEGGLSRKASPRRCRQCRTVTLAGINSVGFGWHADLTPVTPLGEAMELLAGRRTHDIGRDKLLTLRSAAAITKAPAGSDPHRPVLPMHVCGVTRPAAHLADIDAATLAVFGLTPRHDVKWLPDDAEPPF